MQPIRFLFLLSFALGMNLSYGQQTGQDSTGLPGDNFSLQGALEMFKNASSPEDFEKAINTEGNHVNNLDLNGDGDIDYIRVSDVADDKSHVFVLQVPVSETESQDIAVIELEKTGDTSALLQIIGDEDIYGEEVIVEPDGGGDDEGADQKKGKGPYVNDVYDNARIVVNVWYWPSVRFVYAPVYRPWVSPWRWRYYPTWWRPWRPLRWHVWHPYHRHYHRSYVVVHTHRTVHAHHVYTPKRTTSVSVRTRHSASVGNYRVNRSKTTVTGPRGGTATVRKTTVKGPRGNTTTVKRGTATGPRGNVKASKTTVKRRRG
jgi:hypothetical protein